MRPRPSEPMALMDAAADVARYQLNDAPESPFTVEFATEVLVEIRQSALEAFRSLPYGGLEIGGVLFGRVSPSGRNPKRVEVAATRSMDCDHAAGPAFILSSAERVRLTQLFEHARHEEDLAALAVVGFWVSHGRSELGLTSHDADLYRAFFPHPWQVALMLKPENRQPLREALFCRVNARVVPYKRPSDPVEAPSAPIAPPAAPSILSAPEPIAPAMAPPIFQTTFTPPAVVPPTVAPPAVAPEPIALEPMVPEPASQSAAPEPEYYVPEYREPEHVEPAPADTSDTVAETAPEPALPLLQAFPPEPFRIPSFQERVWQEQALHEQTSRHEPAEEEQPLHAEVVKPVAPEPQVVKPPTAAELPRFATDIYLPTPPVEPPSTKAWAKDLYRPAGRARSLVQALPAAPPPAPVSAPVPVSEPAASEPVPARADFVEEIPRLRSYWETEPEPQPEHPEPVALSSAPAPLPEPPRNIEAAVEADVPTDLQDHLQQQSEAWPPQELLSAPEPEALPEEAHEHLEPATENIAVLEAQDYVPSTPPSLDLPGPSAELLRKVEAVKAAGSREAFTAAPLPPALPKPVEPPVVSAAESIPAPPRLTQRELYVAPVQETPKVEVAPAEAAKVEATKAETPAPSQTPVVQAAEIGDELARLLVSIRAAAADTKTKRPVVEDDDPAVHPRQPKHSFGLVTVVLLMIAGLLLGGVLGYWFFGNHQPVAAKAPGPDLGLEMFNTGKEVLIHWDAKSPMVLNARAAELRIHDSGMVQSLLLDLSGLSKGYFRYQPTSSDVQTTLVVTENDGHTEQSNASRFAE